MLIAKVVVTGFVMFKKIRRLSYNQLKVLGVFLEAGGKIVTARQLEKKVKLKGKSLGGVISSLSRTRFRGISLIEPMGKDLKGLGLRWLLNEKIVDAHQAKKEVSRMLRSYD